MGSSSTLIPPLIGSGVIGVVVLSLRLYFSLDKQRVKQVREIATENEGLRRQNDKLEARLDEARHQLLDVTAQASIAETRVTQRDIEIKSLNESIGRLEAEIRTLRGGGTSA